MGARRRRATGQSLVSPGSRSRRRFAFNIRFMNAQAFRWTSRTPCVLAMIFAAAGCDGNANPAPNTGGSLVISAFADADVLLPPLTTTGQGLQVVDAIFDRLAQPVLQADGSTKFLPALATGWKW